MKKMLMKVLAAFLLVVLLASTNGITVLAEGVAEEVRDAYNSEESAEDETSESEESTTEETTGEAVSEDESVSEETEEESSAEESVSEEAEEESSAEESASEEEESSTEDMVVEDEEIPVDAQGAAIVHSGTWGDSVTWTLDEEGVLTVTQDETVAYEYFTDTAPWSEYAGDVKKLVWGANCLKKYGNVVLSAISFGNSKWNSSAQRS